MPRPGFVLDVEKSTPPTMIWRGEQLTTERLPYGSRVLYAPEPIAALARPGESIGVALENPIDGDPLSSHLRPGLKLTIAFDDASSPLPPMKSPDNRQRVIETVLNMAADAGIDDVELVVARGLNRRLYESELRHILGDRIYDSFAPKGLLKQHDAEDSENLEDIGQTDKGEKVDFNKRAASSDLLVYVGINTVATDAGWKGIATGLVGYKTNKHHFAALLDSPSATAGSHERVGKVIAKHVKIFHIETTLDSNTYPSNFSFLTKREWEWSVKDRIAFAATQHATEVAPSRANRKFFNLITSPQAITGVFAGSVDAAHKAAVNKVHEQQLVGVDGQTDILSIGVPYVSPYSVHSITNPILMVTMALGYLFNLHKNKPLVRAGGVAIIHHPAEKKFHPVHHPSYIDFFDQVLSESTDASIIESKFEDKYATDPWFKQLYRTSNAFHGAHPFLAWYECAAALKHLGGVIVVGGNNASVRRLGFRSATTFQDAFEMARDISGRTEPTLTHLHAPPTFIADVS